MQLGTSWDAVGVASFSGSDNGQFLIFGGGDVGARIGGGDVGARIRVVQRYVGPSGPIIV